MQGSPFLSIEQCELRALLNNMNELLFFMPQKACEEAIQVLIPLLSDAVSTKELATIVSDVEGKKGNELIQTILERRNPSRKRPSESAPSENESGKKQDANIDQESGEEKWAPFELKNILSVVQVERFGKQGGEYGLFVLAIPTWTQQRLCFFANAQSLKSVKKTKNATILKRDLASMKKSPDMIEFLKQINLF